MCALIGLKNLIWQNAIGGFTTDFIEILYHYQGIKVFFFFFWSITKVSKFKACIDDL